MSTFSFSIGALDEAAKTVPVTFTVAGANYSRPVNAVIASGSLDDSATMIRVLDVGRGLLNKIALGVAKTDAEIAEMAPPPPPTDDAPVLG